MNMQDQILIFRTTIEKTQDIGRVRALFATLPQIDRWNVDLEDREKILRIECREITPVAISSALRSIDIFAEELE